MRFLGNRRPSVVQGSHTKCDSSILLNCGPSCGSVRTRAVTAVCLVACEPIVDQPCFVYRGSRKKQETCVTFQMVTLCPDPESRHGLSGLPRRGRLTSGTKRWQPSPRRRVCRGSACPLATGFHGCDPRVPPWPPGSVSARHPRRCDPSPTDRHPLPTLACGSRLVGTRRGAFRLAALLAACGGDHRCGGAEGPTGQREEGIGLTFAPALRTRCPTQRPAGLSLPSVPL